MTLNVYSFGAYATYGSQVHSWRDEDYQVNRLVRALKGHSFRGYADIKDVDGVARRISASTRDAALELFGRWAVRKLVTLGIRRASIVPVPASDHVDFNHAFVGSDIAKAISRASGATLTAAPILAFRQAMEKAHKGASGGRNRRLIKENLVCSRQRVADNVILVDDVMTSGAHFRACAEFLRDRGATVAVALCAGRATQEPVETPLVVEPEDIEDVTFGFEDIS